MPMRQIIAKMITLLPMRSWNKIYDIAQYTLPSSLREMKYVGLKMHRLSEVMYSSTLAELYCTANTHWRPPYHPVPFHRGTSVLTKYSLEKEREACLPFLKFLVVIVAGKANIVFIFGAKNKSPGKIHFYSNSHVCNQVLAVFHLDQSNAWARRNLAKTQSKKGRITPF